MNILLGLLGVVLFIVACEEDTIGDNSFGSLEGTVVSGGSNEPVTNVKITTNPVSTTVFTDENGEFIIAELAVGEYSVQAEQEEYKTAFEPAQISSGRTSTVVFELDSVDVDNLPPVTPELLFPEDGALGVPTSAEFQWSSAVNDEDEITYSLELRNGETNKITLYEDLRDTTLVVSGLSIGKNYFWQVKATDGINIPVQSALSSFTVQGVGDNSIYFVRNVDGNNTIFSGEEPNPESDEINLNEVQLTDASFNSYKPKYNLDADRVAFIRSTGGGEQIFTMNLDGTDQRQITSTIPIAGFRNTELEFAWAGNGTAILYPNFDKLFRVGVNGGGSTLVYQTPDGSLISEVATPDFDQDLLVIKTNDLNGYEVRIFTYRISTGLEEGTILEGVSGAAGSIDITANADVVLYSLDTSGSQNSIYRQFSSRLFLYEIGSGTATAVDTEVLPGENDFDAQFSPSEGAIIFTRAANNIGAQTSIFKRQLDEDEDVDADDLLFTEAFMPDW
jgi:Tol biopolymer transport system component